VPDAFASPSEGSEVVEGKKVGLEVKDGRAGSGSCMVGFDICQSPSAKYVLLEIRSVTLCVFVVDR
jgi:hypothetical protein